MFKNFLNKRKTRKETERVVRACTTPIIEFKLTLMDGANVITHSEAINLLVDALGEDTATEWHAKYMNKVNALAEEAVKELEELVKAEKKRSATKC